MKEMILHNTLEKSAIVILGGIFEPISVVYLSAGFIIGHVITWIYLKKRYEPKR